MERQLSIAIKKIKEVEFSIVSTGIVNKDLAIGFIITTEFNLKEETLSIFTTYDLKDSVTQKALVHIVVATTFYIQKIKDFVAKNGKGLELPDNGLITMLSLSISHTRAILAKNTSGTIYEDHYIPIVNPSEVAKHVFKR